MPRVWVECPDVEFQIAGANPPKKIEAMAGDKIKLSANVPDMLPYLQRAAIFVHPHSGGSGIQNKLIEAMASGCAVVTTETGTQGLPAENGKNIMIGKNDAEIASYIITLLKNKELTEEIGKNARKAIVENLSWEVVYNQTDRILSELTG
jgi:glycosyltransferase involved in cell wall biosynthesis